MAKNKSQTKVGSDPDAPDYITHVGSREIRVDLYQVNNREWKALFDKKQPEEEADKTIARIIHWTPEELQELNVVDKQAIILTVLKRFTEVMKNPF